jgi:hypothetical protein
MLKELLARKKNERTYTLEKISNVCGQQKRQERKTNGIRLPREYQEYSDITEMAKIKLKWVS